MNLRSLFPRASKAFLLANPNGVSSGPEPKPPVLDDPLAKKKGKGQNPGRVLVRITSYRTVLADADALCGKYFVDALRYSGLIHDDREEDIEYSCCQKKVESKAQQKTLVEVIFP